MGSAFPVEFNPRVYFKKAGITVFGIEAIRTLMPILPTDQEIWMKVIRQSGTDSGGFISGFNGYLVEGGVPTWRLTPLNWL